MVKERRRRRKEWDDGKGGEERWKMLKLCNKNSSKPSHQPVILSR